MRGSLVVSLVGPLPQHAIDQGWLSVRVVLMCSILTSITKDVGIARVSLFAAELWTLTSVARIISKFDAYTPSRSLCPCPFPYKPLLTKLTA